MAKGERTSLAGWIASLTPFFRRAPTTSTTPTGREGNVASLTPFFRRAPTTSTTPTGREGNVASLTPFFRRAPTTSTTPTGREGNVAPAVHPTYSFGSQPQNNNQNHSGNDPTALWGNLGASGRSATKRFVEDQAASPSSWKTPRMAAWMAS